MVGVGLVGCLGAFFVTRQLSVLDEPPIPVTHNADPSRGSIQPQALKKNERYVYPYSVIPGGVKSREELASMIASDPVVLQHYAKFAVGQARIINAAETQMMHVAYRIQNKVYWSSKKIRIPKGETLITDGKETARTRCGNRVSAVPLEPVLEKEPSVESFDVPQIAELVSETGLDKIDVPEMTPLIPGQAFSPPTIPPAPRLRYVPNRQLAHYRPLFVVRPNDVVVPEPTTFSLLAIGLAGLAAFKFTRKK